MIELPFHYVYRKSNLCDQKPPLLLMLHGYGSNEKDLFSFSEHIPKKYTVVSIRAPHDLGMGFAWYDIGFDHFGNKVYDTKMAIGARDSIRNYISLCHKKFDTNPQLTTLLGFSQGAILCNAIALTNPIGIKNIISLSGGVDKKIINISKENLDSVSFYFSHGLFDDVLPFREAKESLDLLTNNGIDFHFENFPSGHGVSPENFKSMLKWLISNS